MVTSWRSPVRSSKSRTERAYTRPIRGHTYGVDDVVVEAGGLSLPGALTVPAGARAVVAFAHGSGSSRLSPRNVAVAAEMHGRSLATLLFDLLTPTEAGDQRKVFDIPLLAWWPSS